MKFLMTWFWSPRMRSTFEVSRRPGCARRSTSWRSSGRPARPVPSSVEDQPEALAVGPAHDVVDEVRRDRRGGLLDGHDAAVREPLVRLAGLAVHVVLADQRLRADLAARVLAEVAEAGLRDLDGHHGLGRLALLLLDLEVGRLAGVHAAHAEVAALDEAERVVELDLVGPALRASGPTRRPARTRRRTRRGPAITTSTRLTAARPCRSRRSRAASRSSSESTFEPSFAGASAAPGQRRYCLVASESGWRTGDAVIMPRAVAPSASKPPPVVEKSSNQPRKSVVYGRAKPISPRAALERVDGLLEGAARLAHVEGPATGRVVCAASWPWRSRPAAGRSAGGRSGRSSRPACGS